MAAHLEFAMVVRMAGPMESMMVGTTVTVWADCSAYAMVDSSAGS